MESNRTIVCAAVVLSVPGLLLAQSSVNRDVLPGDMLLRQFKDAPVEHASGTSARVWMTGLADDPSSSPSTGATTIQMTPGSCTSIGVWIEDPEGSDILNAFQIVMPWFADGGSQGEIQYLDIEADDAGDSISVNEAHPTYVLALGNPPIAPILFENPQVVAAAFAAAEVKLGLVLSSDDVPNPGGPNYMLDFEYCASPDAAGTFELNFNLHPSRPPLSACFDNCCGEYVVTWQPLNIDIVECVELAACADIDADGVRDDGCTFKSSHRSALFATPAGSRVDIIDAATATVRVAHRRAL